MLEEDFVFMPESVTINLTGVAPKDGLECARLEVRMLDEVEEIVPLVVGIYVVLKKLRPFDFGRFNHLELTGKYMIDNVSLIHLGPNNEIYSKYTRKLHEFYLMGKTIEEGKNGAGILGFENTF